MSDARKFCWGLFIGMGFAAALDNHAVVQVTQAGVLMVGLMAGSLVVIIFGTQKVSP